MSDINKIMNLAIHHPSYKVRKKNTVRFYREKCKNKKISSCPSNLWKFECNGKDITYTENLGTININYKLFLRIFRQRF